MISVVMATYNGEKYIIKQLDSILNQTLLPDEVIISDDNSQDQTAIMVEGYIKKHNLMNWKVLTNDVNCGHYKNFMKALQHSNGNFIFLSDQDDIWELDKIEKTVDIMSKDDSITCLRSKSLFIDSDDNLISEGKKLDNSLTYPDYYQQLTAWGSGYEMTFRKSVLNFIFEHEIQNVSAFDYHDVLLSYISSLIGKNVILNSYLNYHRYHQNNATRKSTYKYCADTIEKRTELIQLQTMRIKTLKEIMQKNNIENVKLIEAIDEICMTNDNRIKFLKNKKGLVFKLIQHRRCYMETKTLLGDILCGFKINDIIQKIH